MICCKHKILFWIFNLEICNFDENNQVVNIYRIKKKIKKNCTKQKQKRLFELCKFD
jgi:hypothetical protein